MCNINICSFMGLLLNQTKVKKLIKLIESDKAILEDYYAYVKLLVGMGLEKSFIYIYLKSSRFFSWEEFIDARKTNPNKYNFLVNSIIGLGVGTINESF